MRYSVKSLRQTSLLLSEGFTDVLEDAYEFGLSAVSNGKVADYIPELSKANPNNFGIYVLDADNDSYAIGNVDERFTIQSISKVINLGLALNFRGFQDTFSHVRMEPSGDAFNSITKLESQYHLPFNPMINAGAIQTVSLLANDFSFDDMLHFAQEMCIDDTISLDETVYRSEIGTCDRNRAIAYLLKSNGVLQADPDKTVDLYIKMCSLSINAKSLAGLGLIISNNGVNPYTGHRLIAEHNVRTIKSIMLTCGLYDFSGEFVVRVGVPAKSGVGGGLVCAPKGSVGIGLYGPSLDVFGNSIAAVNAMEYMSPRLNLHFLGCAG